MDKMELTIMFFKLLAVYGGSFVIMCLIANKLKNIILK